MNKRTISVIFLVFSWIVLFGTLMRNLMPELYKVGNDNIDIITEEYSDER